MMAIVGRQCSHCHGTGTWPTKEGGFTTCPVCKGQMTVLAENEILGYAPFPGGVSVAIHAEDIDPIYRDQVRDLLSGPVQIVKVRREEDVSQRLREERQKDYGSPFECHQAIAAAWSAVLRQVTPTNIPMPSDFLDARTVALMLAVMKLVREAYHHKQDNIDDARVYLDFVEEFSK